MTLVTSPLFGTMALQYVEDGAQVTEGEDIGEIEAMKVMTRIHAPAAGTLTWLVELGAVVGEGDEVAEIVE